MQRRLFAASSPERCVQSRIEFIMDGQEIPDVVPCTGVIIVVEPRQRGSGSTKAVDQRIGQGTCFDPNTLKGRRFEWFHKSDGVAYADDIPHPVPRIAATPKF